MKRGLFIFLGLAIAIICNVARTVVLVLVVSRWGVDALSTWHEPTDLAVLVTAFALLGLMASWMRGKTLPEPRESSLPFRSYLFERNGVPLVVLYTTWEEVNPDRLSGRVLQDYSGLSRLQRVLTHERNLGQQGLEFVLTDRTGFRETQSRFKYALPLSWKRA